MDEKMKIELIEIIECKNCFGIPVFDEEERVILKDLYGVFGEENSYESICDKYGINPELLNEITRAFDNIRKELNILSSEDIVLVKKK